MTVRLFSDGKVGKIRIAGVSLLQEGLGLSVEQCPRGMRGSSIRYCGVPRIPAL